MSCERMPPKSVCQKCAPFGGFWMQLENGGFTRCTCDDGRRLAATDEKRNQGSAEPPRLTPEDALVIVEMLSNLDFFPPAGGARLLVCEEIRSMVHSPEDGVWLAQRMVRLYQKWPGLRELRTVYCSRCRPLDGVELIGTSETYPDGIPSERPQLPAPEMKRLAAGEPVTAADSINETVLALAEAKDMRNITRRVPVPDIPILPAGKRISQADVEAAVNQSREQIARKELGE